jgi:tetratricopeptide (TPR) repeat protein
MDWSYALLTAAEQTLLCRLSVFAGSWTLEAAEAIGADDMHEPDANRHRAVAPEYLDATLGRDDVLDLLAGLVRKSLVVVAAQPGAARYGMLETVRHYARRRLDDAGEAERIRSRLRTWCAALVQRAARTGAMQSDWLDQVEAELDNLRAAMAWCIGSDGSAAHDPQAGQRMAACLAWFWDVRGHLTEGRHWLDQALAQREDDPVAREARATALNAAGGLAYRQGDYAQATVRFAESLALRRELDDASGVAATLNNLANLAQHQGDHTRAATLLRESIALKRAAGDRRGEAISLVNLGTVMRDQGDYAQAAALHEASLMLFRELGMPWGIAAALTNLGEAAYLQGAWDVATACYRESLALARELGNKESIAQNLEGLAAIAGARGHVARAAQLFGAASALREAIGVPVPAADRALYERMLAQARAALALEAFAAAWAAGSALPLEDAMALADEIPNLA